MQNIEPVFQQKILSKAKDENEYRLYKAALEWNLVDPIIIESQDDFKSRPEWHDRLEPYYHQVINLITFCRRLPVTLLADDVGLGKTISAGLVISELMARNRISKVLIVCPKILIPQWGEELNTKFGIKYVEAEGGKIVSAELPGGKGAKITTYQTAMRHLDKFAEDGYQMLILDEAHKLRNLYGTNKAPQVALCFQKALSSRMFKYVLMLTATPIHNRLWDIYSLIDLLAVARGHENPLGSKGLFARNYILDRADKARKLVPEKSMEFRDIVYKYMHRTRRADVKLYFPDRKIYQREVIPTPGEFSLIEAIAGPIQDMHPLVQINLLQALVSSPEAFYSQLRSMGRNGTIEMGIVEDVREIVNQIGISAKLKGLKSLINELKREKGEKWRMVIFTERRETQTTIEIFLDSLGISCGLINGDTAATNKDTLEKFRKEIPEINVIISTRAGSEGMNLQVSNILVNYDLPWNPMIVEQRIGRVQRLASDHRNVVIFNMILKGTFEEYIVGRLIEKLQMVSNAIGDIEGILEVFDDDDEGSFEDKIRKLVIDSLAGKDVKEATRQIDESIDNARKLLEEEKENMNVMLGSSIEMVETGPRCPKLPSVIRSMNVEEFTILALKKLNAPVEKVEDYRYLTRVEGRNFKISFRSNESESNYIVCKSGVPFFERLVTGLVVDPKHFILDNDINYIQDTSEAARRWVSSFDGIFESVEIKESQYCLTGKAVIRINSSVAHDSYERLVEIDCSSFDEYKEVNAKQIINFDVIGDIRKIGLNEEDIKQKILDDKGVFEFCRFYQERLFDELKSAGGSIDKKRKLENDFTPHIEATLAGLEGVITRNLKVDVKFTILDHDYSSNIQITPSMLKVINAPEIKECEKSNLRVPVNCLNKCEISKRLVLLQFLKKSEISGRLGLEENTKRCSYSNKLVLSDEVEKSAVTDKLVASLYLKTSSMSKKKAEPEFFGICEFTNTEVLKEELAISQASGKRYRKDQEISSSVSGKRGHKDEFIFCTVKDVPLLPVEAQYCEVTGRVVSPGIVEKCEITGKMVLPSELEKCHISGKIALKKFFVTSSISGYRILEENAIKSSKGKFCSLYEVTVCSWSDKKYHQDDIVVDSLSGLPMHFQFIEESRHNSFKILLSQLDGKIANAERQDFWIQVEHQLEENLKGAKIISSILSPMRKHLSICAEKKSMLGLKKRYVGFLYNIKEGKIEGRIISGKREKNYWSIIY